MNLKTRLKVNQVKNLTDARYFAAVGAEWLGFEFDPTAARSVSVELAKEIKAWLAGPRFFGSFGSLTVENINEICTSLEMDICQVGEAIGFEKLDRSIQSIIHRIDISSNDSAPDIEAKLEHLKPNVAQFSLNFETKWTDIKNGNHWTVEAIQTICAKYPVFLKMDFTKENVLEILEKIKPFGIELQGGDEIVTGMQSFDEVGEIIDLLEMD